MNFEIKVPANEAKTAVEKYVEDKIRGDVNASVLTVHKDGSMTVQVSDDSVMLMPGTREEMMGTPS